MLEKQLKLLCPTISSGMAALMVNQAKDAFMAYCNVDSVPEAAHSVVLRLAAYYFGHAGADGLASENVSGISESYLTDYPDELKRSMNRFRRVKLL